ncbi:MAG: TetR/AcrR family transcriptional regulator [bacterium]
MAVYETRVAEAPGKREAILDAALRLFSEHTFDGTAMPLIAERANVGAGTIYRYFDSKEALVNAVYRKWKAEMKRVLVDEAPRGVTPRAEFGHWWRGLWRFARENPAAFTFLETHHHESYLDEDSRVLSASLLEGTREFVRRAQDSGTVRSMDADLLIALVFGSFTGLARAMEMKRQEATPELVAETEECVWTMISNEMTKGGP